MVDDITQIENYFELTATQRDQLQRLHQLHVSLRERLNLISRGDIEHLWIRHILHSLSIAKFLPPDTQATCLDIGTGGGFPTLPLAILFPQHSFVAIDGRQKKIRAVQEMVDHLALANVKPMAVRAEDFEGAFQFILARAVAPLPKLLAWSEPLFAAGGKALFLKGGDLGNEIGAIAQSWSVASHDLSEHYEAPFFAEKYLLEIQQNRSV